MNTLGDRICHYLIPLAMLSGGCNALNAQTNDNLNTEKITPFQELNNTGTSEVNVQPIKTEPYTADLEITGKTTALRDSYLSLSVPGLIKSIPVQLGDRVKKGQVLARLDRRGFQLSVKQAQAALDGAKAATEQLATEMVRMDQLLADGAAPSAAKDDLLAKDKGAQAQVRMAGAALEQANKALKDAVLKAPYDGTITEILKEAGEQAPAMPPTMLMKIVDTSRLDVQVFAPESASPYIKPGTQADVIVDSANVTMQGEVVFASNVIQPGSRTFEVRIRIDNPEDRIKAGAFARVQLAQESIKDAILIPVSVISRDDKDRPYVFIAKDEKALKRPVDLGPPKGARVLVRQGLAAGDELIVSDTANLKDGQRISIRK